MRFTAEKRSAHSDILVFGKGCQPWKGWQPWQRRNSLKRSAVNEEKENIFISAQSLFQYRPGLFCLLGLLFIGEITVKPLHFPF